jgi:hypothetical protein
MNFKIELTGLKEFQESLSDMAKTKIPTALANASNATVYGARAAEQQSMQSSFDRPTPFVLRNVLYQKAVPERLVAEVRIAGEDDWGMSSAAYKTSGIIGPHITGGPRNIKASEKSLRRLGVLGPSQFVTPGPGAKRDQYGNIAGPEMVRILSGASVAESAAGFLMNISYKSRKRNKKAYGDIFCIPYKGIFRRMGPNSIIPVLFFTSSAPQYRKRFDFYGAFKSYVQENFLKNLLQAWGSVMLKAGRNGG